VSTRGRRLGGGLAGAAVALGIASCNSCDPTWTARVHGSLTDAAVDGETKDSTPTPDVGPDGPEDARPDADASHDADADAATTGTDGCAPLSPPSAVPVGWERFEGWSCECPLYVRGVGGEPLPEVQWEPCPEPVPQDITCLQMKDFWNGGAVAVGIFPRLSTEPDTGKTLIAFDRMFYDGNPDVRYRVVAEADGPVRMAFLQVNPMNRGCEFGYAGLSGDTYLLKGLGDTWNGSLQDPVMEGAVVGRVSSAYPDATLKLLAETNAHSSWSVSSEWIVQRKWAYVAWSRDFQTKHTVYDPAQDPDYLPGGVTTLIGKEVFVEVGDGRPAGVMVWNADEGLRPLIRWYGDGSRGAGNFATDGTDMVWTYVEGAYHGDGTYDTMRVMTAPFTTDAAEAQATSRRVRSDLKGFDPYVWVVGCGYAARSVSLASIHNALFIVRLSDGVSWTLPGESGPPKLSWGLPTGATCDELFTTLAYTSADGNNINTIARIRFDSLGPGTPPD